jgi:hypothetical protein
LKLKSKEQFDTYRDRGQDEKKIKVYEDESQLGICGSEVGNHRQNIFLRDFELSVTLVGRQ